MGFFFINLYDFWQIKKVIFSHFLSLFLKGPRWSFLSDILLSDFFLVLKSTKLGKKKNYLHIKSPLFYQKKSYSNNFFIFLMLNGRSSFLHFLFYQFLTISNVFKVTSRRFLLISKKSFGDGYLFIRGILLILLIDSCFSDDEPLWEPLEWSLVQTWIFFIFLFAWVAENLITSRYGSYTGRDKRVWFAWYKSFWLLECWYALSFATAALFVIVPFYYELTYNLSFTFSWWNWYNRIFFFKFISTYSIVLLFSYFFQLNIRWLNWKKLVVMILFINFFIAYLLYSHFLISFFGYFTDPLWYQKTRFIDYIQLSHEPLKWGWGPAKRDHFTYHKVSTVFWFKNDGPFAGAFLLIHLFFFLSIFFLYLYWVILLRRVYTTKEITYTFATFCVSSLRQFFYFFFMFFFFIITSFLINYWRFPIEFLWVINVHSWFINFIYITKDYFWFLLNL